MKNTTNNLLNLQPTKAAFAEGMRAAQGKSHLYNIQRIHPASRSFWVSKKRTAEGYYVMTGHRHPEDNYLSAVNCQCERFQFVDALGEKRGYCSHCAMVEEVLRIEAAELEFDEITDGRFCVEAGKH